MSINLFEQTTANSKSDINDSRLPEQLINISVNGLSEMFDKEKQFFSYRAKRAEQGIVNEGHSFRYTIISLLGLSRLEQQGKHLFIDSNSVLENLLNNAGKIDNIGDLGLLLWLCALTSPESANRLFVTLDTNNALKQYPDAIEGKTTELAWFLTGLSYLASAPIKKPQGIEDLTKKTYELLKQNYEHKGIFRHQNRNTLKGIIRGRMGCFADQVYPIYALSKFAQAYDNKEALRIAKECGETICNLQGTLGQWWWHYDSANGRVLGRYPVYSVHQDGMAPMALFSLSKASGLNFNDAAYKGLNWITGNNELSYNMIDNSRNVTWRSFYRKKPKMRFEELMTLAGFDNNNKEYNDLMILFECRSYHLGWLLYALADKK